MTLLLLSLAGALGAVCRAVLDGAARGRWPHDSRGLLAVNVSGSLLLGLVTGLVLFHDAPVELRTVLGTGFCGGYTTFSTASLDSVRLAQRGRWGAAAANAGGTLLLTLLAAAAGLVLASLG